MTTGKNGWKGFGKAKYLKFKKSNKTVMCTGIKTFGNERKVLCKANGKSFVVSANFLKVA